jgi:hypothetical protein
MIRCLYCLLDPTARLVHPNVSRFLCVAKGAAEEEVAAHSGEPRSSTSYGDRVGRVLSMLSPA